MGGVELDDAYETWIKQLARWLLLGLQKRRDYRSSKLTVVYEHFFIYGRRLATGFSIRYKNDLVFRVCLTVPDHFWKFSSVLADESLLESAWFVGDLTQYSTHEFGVDKLHSKYLKALTNRIRTFHQSIEGDDIDLTMRANKIPDGMAIIFVSKGKLYHHNLYWYIHRDSLIVTNNNQ